jgi:APA family basic amino acid/polyamine antiporter
MAKDELKRGLGLGGAISILIGYVIGASIFILIGPIAFKTGPALWVTYLIASLPAIFMCFTSAQIGSTLPVAGANYVLVSRTMGPFWGFMTVWTIMITTLIGIPLVAYGFAQYLGFFIPGLPPMGTAIAVTVLFGIINIIGISVTGWIQNLMVIVMMLALAIFSIVGVFHVHPENIKPLMPNGFSPVVIAAIPAYFSYVGFMVLAELGEEIRKPSKNIPLAILIAFFAVLVAYLLTTFVLTGILPYSTLDTTEAAVAAAAKTFLPYGVVAFISVGAIVAAFTTVNGILATSPRELFALGRDKVLPGWLATTSKALKTPWIAISVVTLLGIIGILLGQSIEKYAFITVMGVMVFSFLIGIGSLRIRKKLPDHYKHAAFTLKGFWYWFFPIGVLFFAAVYILLGFVEDVVSVGIFMGAILLGGLLFVERRWRLKRSGIDMVDIFEKDLEGVLKRAKESE